MDETNETIIPRQDWGALPPGAQTRVEHPIPNIMFSYLTGSDTCATFQECAEVLRNVQRKHMGDMRMPDIAYNFIIGGDGKIYEGRGWLANPPRFNRIPQLNFKTYYIGILGDLNDDRPSKSMWESTWKIIELAYKLNYIQGNVQFTYEDL